MKNAFHASHASLGTLALFFVVTASGCTKKSEASTAPSAAPPSAEAPAGDDGSYALTTSVADCAVGATCTVTLRVEARGEFHLNPEYPYKFTAGDVAGVDFLGTDGGGKNVFTKAAGDFAKQSEKVGVMTVKFKPSKAGDVTIAGVYKLSVCSDATCKLDNPSAKVTLAVR
jgi:hypothetical protein